MPSNGLLRAELEPSQVRDRRNEAARCLIGPMTSEMDWLQWYFGPSLQAPFTAMTTLNGKPLPTDLDVQLIELIYLVVANELECAECGHLLGRGLRVRDTAIGPPPAGQSRLTRGAGGGGAIATQPRSPARRRT